MRRNWKSISEELKRSGDLDAAKYLGKSIEKVQRTKRISRYKYANLAPPAPYEAGQRSQPFS